MEIKTKFNLRDFVFYIDNGEIKQGIVEKIERVAVSDPYVYKETVKYCEVHYTTYKVSAVGFHKKLKFYEAQIFATQEELLEHQKTVKQWKSKQNSI
jgi:hypothetical protein|nr:MAG TPA: hypothetical protein [Caudoviricetes sp.]